MYDYNCPDCNEAKLQSDKNARKINEVINQVNSLIQVNNQIVDFIEEKVDEVVPPVVDREVDIVIGDIITKTEELGSEVNGIKLVMDTKADQTETRIIQAQLNNLVLGAVGDGNNAEVIQARTSVFGSYNTLSEHINAIAKVMQRYSNMKHCWDWAVGGINGNNLNVTNQHWRISTPRINFTTVNIELNMDFSIYEIGYITYNADGTVLQDKGWFRESLIIPSGTYFRISIQKINYYAEITDVYSSDLFINLKTITEDCIDLIKEELELLKASIISDDKLKSKNCVKNTKVIDLVVSTGCQATNIINDEIWVWYASSDDVNGYKGQITKFDKNTYAYKGDETKIFHNLGHVPSADYCDKNDTLMVTNGTNGTGILPKLQFYRNLSNNNGFLYQDNENYFDIDISNLGSGGHTATFGEAFNIVYIYNGKLHKIILGVGDIDLSSYLGTFRSGCSENEFNGTAKIIETYNIDFINDTMQTLTYHNGYIYLLIGHKNTSVFKVSLIDSYCKLEECFRINDYDVIGDIVEYEPEGICFNENELLISMFNSTIRKVVRAEI